MLIYEIISHIIHPDPEGYLSYTFSLEIELVSVVLVWENRDPQVQKFEFNRKTSINGTMSFN